MPTEIELKLRLNPAQARRLVSQPVLAAAKPAKYRLFNTYYDTPDRELWRRGIALRLRRKGRSEWLMTVKGSDPSGGALAQRREWEIPTQPGVFDFDCIDDAGLRAFLQKRQAMLRPVFSTDFTRTAWVVERSGALIEVALDRGRIHAASGEEGAALACEPICELELELLEGGSPDALFEVAIELAADVHLHPAIASKAERGYALAAGCGAPAARATPSPLDRRMSPGQAFRSIALSCLLHLQRNEDGALAGQDPEYVHQARVAIRRLRSCINLFSPMLAPAFVEVYAPRWADLARQLGGARDWDVFLAETLEPLEEAFPGDPDLQHLRQRSQAIQADAQASAGGVLTGMAYSQLLLAFSAALFRSEPPTIDNPLAKGMKLRKFAGRRLQKRHAAVRRIAVKASRMGDGGWHRLRIACKKLRYSLEFFAPVLPHAKLKSYLQGLSAIQELLGKLNDQIVAERLMRELHPATEAEAEPVPLASGWLAGRKHLLVENLCVELDRFMSRRRPW